MNATAADPRSKKAAQQAIQFAMVAGVLAFGCVAWYVSRSAAPEGGSPDGRTLRLVFAVVAAAAAAGIAGVRAALSRATDPKRAGSLRVTGWAMGEVPALLGGVAFVLTGKPMLYVIGLAIMIVALLLVPAGEAE